jgi:predicted Fe-Mo cluster-binding NifX family protein
MGPKAVELFQQKGIDVLLGVKGNASQVAETFAAGRLQPGISSCHH